MNTVLSHDRGGWLRDAQIGSYLADENVLILETTGTGGITLTLHDTHAVKAEADLTPAQLDQVIEGLLVFRAAHKIDRVRRNKVQAGIRDAANRRRVTA